MLIANRANNALVSTVSLWEIIIKTRIGKLSVDLAEIESQMQRHGLLNLPIKDAHLRVLETLPRHHRDPFDHLLISQAIAEGAYLLSSDRRAVEYPVRVVAC
jgi:PIN domain nuclease of toxin-antitoxin system